MKLSFLIAALAFAQSASKAPGLEQLVQIAAPKDWKESRQARRYEARKDDGLIRVRLFGPGDEYPNSRAFINGFSARSYGKPPKREGTVTVSGIKTALFKRQFPIMLGDPHKRGGPQFSGEEWFCLLPAGRQYFVLSYARESPVPDIDGAGRKAFDGFLKNFKLIRARR